MPKVTQLGGGFPGGCPESCPLPGEVAPGIQGQAVPVLRCERVLLGLAGDSTAVHQPHHCAGGSWEEAACSPSQPRSPGSLNPPRPVSAGVFCGIGAGPSAILWLSGDRNLPTSMWVPGSPGACSCPRRSFCHLTRHTGRRDQGTPAHPAGGLSRRPSALLPLVYSPRPAQPLPRGRKGAGGAPAQGGQCRWPQGCTCVDRPLRCAHSHLHTCTFTRARTHTCSRVPQAHACPDLGQAGVPGGPRSTWVAELSPVGPLVLWPVSQQGAVTRPTLHPLPTEGGGGDWPRPKARLSAAPAVVSHPAPSAGPQSQGCR